ncbi:NAD(P)-binding protein [Marasmius fiardii PR-910]|nr:NAD(P)-binding protein [Marasmius fiardii PR-910]
MSDDYKRVILVTGSNTGIGYEIVKGLAEKGQIVYLAARNETSGKEAQKKLKKEHDLDVKFVQLDVGNLKSIEAARDVIEKAEGRLDVLVNNAGISGTEHPQIASELDISVVRSVFETNVFGLIQTTTAFIPLLRKAKPGYGNIVQNSMESASFTYQSNGRPGLAPKAAYCTSKAALNMYSVALAKELKKDGIKVNCVCPGFTTTQLNRFASGGKTPAEGAKPLIEWSLLGPEDDEKTGKYWSANGEVPW